MSYFHHLIGFEDLTQEEQLRLARETKQKAKSWDTDFATDEQASGE